jgi:peroxiredoxin
MSNVNDQAPSFELKNTKKESVSLDSFKGKTVVLAFYPGAFTGVCDTEMCTFNDNLSKLNDSNAVVLGISVDSPWSNGAFKEKYGIKFELLSDYERSVVSDYDVTFTGLGGLDGYVSANRAVFVLNSEGIIKYKWVAENPGVEPNYDEVLAEVDELV